MLYYLSTPYTKYHLGHEMAAIEAALATAHFIRRGIKVFSPIVHSHAIAKIGNLDHLDLDLWHEQNLEFMQRMDGLFVVMMRGWRESVGIRLERDFFEKADKPISFFSWPDLKEIEDAA